jgi:hypothetical protein
VAGSLRAEIEAGADLLILNRFGKGETEGQGFRTVIELAYAKQIPVLTVVRETYVEGWNEFAGDFGVLLAPDQTVLADWLETITPLRALSAAS